MKIHSNFILSIIIILFFYSDECYSKCSNSVDTIDIHEIEIDTNSLQSGIKSIFDGTNQLIIEQHPIAGINYLLDGLSSFFVDCSKNSEIKDSLKEEFYDLIIKFKYQITILLNMYFKLYKEDSRFYINESQKRKIAIKIKQIFSNVINMMEISCNSKNYLKKSITEIFDIVAILFSVEDLIDKEMEFRNFMPLKDVLNTYKALISKCDKVQFNQTKDGLTKKEINEGLERIFNSIVDLGMESNINFIYYKETMIGLLKVILVIFSSDYKGSC